MPKRLSQEQIDHYHENGFVAPIPVLSSEEVTRLRAELERHEAKAGRPMDFPEKSKSYLLYRWADEIVHHPAVLDAVEDIIGPDILVYHQTIWIKEPGTPNYVLWHQDGKYFFLEPHLHITAWVALSEATIDSGCIHVLPGSHKWGDFDHEDDTGDSNMIKRGQGISNLFDDQIGVPMELQPGEMSLHHTDLIHCSRGNGGGDRRIGVGTSYIPASVDQIGAPKRTALSVRGRTRPGVFGEEKRLVHEMSNEAKAAHARSVSLFRQLQDSGSFLDKAS